MLRHDFALGSGLFGGACTIGFAASVLAAGDVGLRILMFLPVAALAMILGDRTTHYATPRPWLIGFASTNAALASLGVYLTWLASTMDGLRSLLPLSIAFVAFLCVSILTPLVLMRGVRERRIPERPAVVNYRSSRGLA